MVELSTETANPPTTEALQEELDALRQEATIHALSVAKPPAPRPPMREIGNFLWGMAWVLSASGCGMWNRPMTAINRDC